MGREVKHKTKLAEAVGVSRKTLYEWMERPDFPGGKSGPWSVARVNKWRRQSIAGGSGLNLPDASTADTDAAPSIDNEDLQALLAGLPDGVRAMLVNAIELAKHNPKDLVEVLWKIERTRKEQLIREAMERKYIERDVLDRAIVGLVDAFVREFDAWVAAVPQQCQGLEAFQIERMLKKRAADTRMRFHRLAEIELASATRVDEFKKDGKTPADRPVGRPAKGRKRK